MPPSRSSQRLRAAARLRGEQQEMTPEPPGRPGPGSRPSSPPSLPLPTPTPTPAAPRESSTLPAENPRRSADRPPSHDGLANGKLEGHADRNEDHQQLRQGAAGKSIGTTKRRRDPFARYLSDKANSFPKYAPPSDKMPSQDRLKAINARTGPTNTISRPNPWENAKPGPDGPPAKRQRQEDSQPQRFPSSTPFLRPKLAPKEEIQDLTIDDAQTDVYDIRSVSSGGKGSSTAANVQEYRNAQPKAVGGNTRKRKSRAPSSGQGLPESPASAQHASPVGYRGLESNSADDLAQDSPSPARICSDVTVHGTAKRPMPHWGSSAGPQAKRNKNKSIEDARDADELSRDPSKGHQPEKKRTNFSQVDERRDQHARPKQNRGDIKRTEFKSSRTPNGSSSSSRPLPLKRAVDGPRWYDCDTDPHGPIYLHFVDDVKLEPKTADERDVPYAWLRCDLGRAQRITHAATKSPHVYLQGSSTQQSSGKLHLEMDNEGAMIMITRAQDASTQESEPEFLKKAFSHAFNEAKAHSGSSNAAKVERVDEEHGQQSTAVTRPTPREREAPQKREKLTSKMLRSSGASLSQQLDLTDEPEALMRRVQAPDTRSTRRSSLTLLAPSPSELNHKQWTAENPDWDKRWQKSLVFPATGKNRATVDKDDIPRLDEGEFLNDNLISFYFRYLQEAMVAERPELLQKVYFFSTFFFEKLRATKGQVNYEGVKAWTAKVDLFSYDYIVVPVNEHAHWYLAIICNASYALNGIPDDDDPQEVEVVDVKDAASSPKMPTVEGDTSGVSLQKVEMESKSKPVDGVTRSSASASSRTVPGSPSRSKSKRKSGAASKNDPRQPKVVTLDSLGSPHPLTCRYLRDYLSEAALDKKGTELKVKPTGLCAKGIPEQGNYCDCGVFVLGYVEEFLKDPDNVARKLLQKENVGWGVAPSDLRGKIRELLFSLQEKQQARLGREKEKRKVMSRKKAEKEASRSSSVPASRAQSQGPDGNAATINEELSSKKSVEMQQPVDTLGRGSTSPHPAARGPSRAKTPQLAKATGEVEPNPSGYPEYDSSQSETYYSAASSPHRKPSRGAGRAVGAGEGLQQVDSRLVSRTSGPRFVPTLPSSPSDDEDGKPAADFLTQARGSTTGAGRRARKKGRAIGVREVDASPAPEPPFVRTLSSSSSTSEDEKGAKNRLSSQICVEIKASGDQPSRARGTRGKKKESHVSRFFEPRPSIETDEPAQPQGGPQYDGVERTVDLTSDLESGTAT